MIVSSQHPNPSSQMNKEKRLTQKGIQRIISRFTPLPPKKREKLRILTTLIQGMKRKLFNFVQAERLT